MLLRFISFFLRQPYRIVTAVCVRLPYFRFIHETRDTQRPITFDLWALQRLVGINKGPYWPVHPTSCVVGWRNILAGVEVSPGLMRGCYIQGLGRIEIGDYTQIASNVGIVSANHLLTDNRAHQTSEVKIGAYCWLGMGCIILPGVELGDYTVVGAGAVVTKSFPGGHCVIGGNPARKIKDIPKDECVHHKSEHEYCGYIRKEDFEAFRKAELLV